MAMTLVTLTPDLLEKSGWFKFRGGHLCFSSKILADENTMSVIADMMPYSDGGGYYFKLFSAAIFLGSLCYSDVSFVTSSHEHEPEHEPEHDPEHEPPPPPPPSPEQKKE